MFNRMCLIILAFWAVDCAAYDASYYHMHPAALQDAMKQCPDNPPKGLTCVELQMMAQQTNSLAFELQTDPQLFGQKILALQEAIAKVKLQLQEKPNEPALTTFLEQNNAQLLERLAIVKWLESPN